MDGRRDQTNLRNGELDEIMGDFASEPRWWHVGGMNQPGV